MTATTPAREYSPFRLMVEEEVIRRNDIHLRETLAISMLTDDQAMQSFIRWRTGHGAVVADSLRETLGVEEYIAAIYAKVPA